jgi:hypothetical protein
MRKSNDGNVRVGIPSRSRPPGRKNTPERLTDRVTAGSYITTAVAEPTFAPESAFGMAHHCPPLRFGRHIISADAASAVLNIMLSASGHRRVPASVPERRLRVIRLPSVGTWIAHDGSFGARWQANTRSVIACYHDGVPRKVTTVRMPEDLADQVEAVARGRGVSVNAVVIDALVAEIGRVKTDKQFMARLREVTERDKEILDRLAQ